MFYPQAMTKVRLIIPSRDLMAITNELAELGVFHQSDSSITQPEQAPGKANSWRDQANAYTALERRVLGLIQILNVGENPAPAPDGAAMVDIEAVQPGVETIEREVKTIRDQVASEQKRLEQLESILNQLEPIAGIDLDLDALRQPGYVHSILGVIPTANIDRLQTSLARIPFVFVILRQDPQRGVVWLAGLKRDADVLDRAARSAYLNPLNLPETYKGRPAQIIALLHRDIDEIHKRLSGLNAGLDRLRGEHQRELRSLLAQVRSSRILAEAIARFGKLDYTYVISGWVPSSRIANFSKCLHQVSEDLIIETVQYQRDSAEADVPVALYNPAVVRPFESFVLNYSHPRYQEIDPTFFLSLTFPLLFGAMFGDVGQGLLLAVLGRVLSSRKVKFLNPLAGLAGIITACGVSAAIFGFLYGSIFGFEDVLPALVLRPITNILETMALAISIGVILLSIGFIISIVNSLTSKNWGQLIFSPHGLAGLMLYWSLVGLALEVILGKHPIPLFVFAILALLSALAMVFTEPLERWVEGHRPLVEGGFGMNTVQSFFELFETLIGLLSNSISFVRVGAFAVAHVGLTTVIFILAGLISPGHGVGYWVVVAIGNLFIIGFEGLIVGIQTMRLNYYEFFSKFFTGGGVQYEPLTLQPRAEK